ncbi:MAG: diacylglycerol kinase family lipid kinase [Oscillospiraceae bacterium]|nr:diacylglycerol kinase family lipid kinase [Oscillospiraceae bacterium]
MKHIFIINPAAGKDREKRWLVDSIKSAAEKLSQKAEIYFTKCEGDAYEFAKKAAEDSEENLRLYACGGDGTFNETISAAVGRDNISVGCIPCGTGNDFVKNFKLKEDFLNIQKQMNAAEDKIDIIEANGNYSVNICNMGFDADVADGMLKFKRLPLVSGSMAYSLSVVTSMIKKLGFRAKIICDGIREIEEDIMMMVVANGICYGGGYYGAPKAKIDDGLMDVCIVKKLSRFKIVDLIGDYKKGNHVDEPKFKKYIEYFRCKEIEIEAEKPFTLSRDGEISKTLKANIHIIKNGVNFLNPSKQNIKRSKKDESIVCQF